MGLPMRFHVDAKVGNADGVFDAAYNFGHGSGEEATATGTPEEIGLTVVRHLASLTPTDCDAMRYSRVLCSARHPPRPISLTLQAVGAAGRRPYLRPT